MSALKVVLIGAVVAFGGYSAVAGASMFLGSPREGAALAVAKPELDCASSRFAWRPECQAEKVQAAALPEDEKARRTRRRSTESAAAEAPPSAPAAPVMVAAVEPPAAPSPEPRPSPPKDGAVDRPKASGPEATRTAPRGPSAADRAALDDLVRSVGERPAAADRPSAPDRASAAASSPARQRTSERSLRFRAKPEPEEAEEAGSPRTAKPKAEARRPPLVLRSRFAATPRREEQFASLPSGSTEPRASRRRAASGGEAAEPDAAPSADRSWRAAPRRDIRTARRAPRQPYGGMTVTSERIYELPDGRLISVRTRPRPEVVQDLVARHRAAHASRVAGFLGWGGGWGGY